MDDDKIEEEDGIKHRINEMDWPIHEQKAICEKSQCLAVASSEKIHFLTYKYTHFRSHSLQCIAECLDVEHEAKCTCILVVTKEHDIMCIN